MQGEATAKEGRKEETKERTKEIGGTRLVWKRVCVWCAGQATSCVFGESRPLRFENGQEAPFALSLCRHVPLCLLGLLSPWRAPPHNHARNQKHETCVSWICLREWFAWSLPDLPPPSACLSPATEQSKRMRAGLPSLSLLYSIGPTIHNELTIDPPSPHTGQSCRSSSPTGRASRSSKRMAPSSLGRHTPSRT